MTYGDAMAAQIVELKASNAKLRRRLDEVKRGREMWKARAMSRTKFQRQT